MEIIDMESNRFKRTDSCKYFLEGLSSVIFCPYTSVHITIQYNLLDELRTIQRNSFIWV